MATTVGTRDQRSAVHPASGPLTAGRSCETWGHESVGAVAIGTFDDGDEKCSEAAFCADCTLALVDSGEFAVTQVLDVLALCATACPTCRGTGRLVRVTGRPAPADWATSPHVAALLERLRADDDTPPADMTGGFYARAYWDLRMAVEDLLQGGGTREVPSSSLPPRTS